MWRFRHQNLVSWLSKPSRKPLVIRGARQVGKSTLVRTFALEQGLDLFEVNCERFLELGPAFKTLQPQKILQEIESLLGRKFPPVGGLLFLDEIQATPEALAALRYFYEEMPQIPLIAAGSLLEFVLSNHRFSMPVGRIEYLFLHPMSFQEFLLAQGEKAKFIFDYIKNVTLSPQTQSQITHDKLIDQLRDYYAIGGMPEAISTFIQTGDEQAVHQVHASIAATYQDDFAKYSPHLDALTLKTLFRKIPAQLGKKVKYTHWLPDTPSIKTKSYLLSLQESLLLTAVHHSDASGIPLHAQISDTIWKSYFLDIGLANHELGLGVQEIRRRPIDLIHEGALAEQYVAQHLLFLSSEYSKPELFYWLREGKNENAEVDFVIQRSTQIIPLEIKSGKSGSLKSLLQFVGLKKTPIAIRFDLGPPLCTPVTHQIHVGKELREVSYTLLSLPLYLVEEMDRLLSSLR